MELTFIKKNDKKIAIVFSEELIITELQDAIDIIAEVSYNDSECVIMRESHFSPLFFDLKTGLAGDILQKFSNYKMRLFIIGDFSKFLSKSLQDFIRESNKYKLMNFVSSLEEAIDNLGKNSVAI